MHVYTCYAGSTYKRLAQVWKRSVKSHSDCDVLLQGYDIPKEQRGPRGATSTLRQKLHLWREHLRNTDEPVVFADADMLARGDVMQPFRSDCHFDLAYTVRGVEPGINGGIWWVRPSPITRWYFAMVATVMDAFLEPDDEGDYWLHGHYGAVDQAAMWKTLTCLPPGLTALPLMCADWNACQQHWADAEDPQVVHIKCELRDMVLGETQPTDELKHYIDEWKQYA